MAERIKNPTNIDEDVGLIPGLAQWVKDPAFQTTQLKLATDLNRIYLKGICKCSIKT